MEESKISRNRLESLVDAIFAFAMTLLVTGFVIPALPQNVAPAELPPLIARMRPEFFSFLIAFFVLASFLLGHHRQFHYVRAIDRGIALITLSILASVVMVPFTTNISGDYGNVPAAVDLFHVNLFIMGTLFLAQWLYLARNPAVTSGEIGRPEVVHGMRRSCLVPVVSASGFLVAFFDPQLSMSVYLALIPAFFIVSHISPARKPEDSEG